jgi:hypothetical protein
LFAVRPLATSSVEIHELKFLKISLLQIWLEINPKHPKKHLSSIAKRLDVCFIDAGKLLAEQGCPQIDCSDI